MKAIFAALRLLTVVLLGIHPFSAKADKLVSVDETAGIVNVEGNKGLKAYRTKTFTAVTINGSPSSLKSLKPGMKVSLVLSEGNSIASISAIGNAAPEAPAVPKPSATPGAPAKPNVNPFARPQNLTRKIVIKGKFDGHDEFLVKAGKMSLHHRGWDKPLDITVNGIPWEPQWNGNHSDEFVAFQPALASIENAQVTVRKEKGRGPVKLLEPPTAKNEQTLKFNVDDGDGGAGVYEIRISW